MWRWLNALFGNKPASSCSIDADELVPDDEYEFKFGTKPAMPDGLRDLKITELKRGLLLLESFHIELTIDQKEMDDTPGKIAVASRCLRWAKEYYGINSEPHRPVRLHCGNVLLSPAEYYADNTPENEIALWLETVHWQTERQFHFEVATTNQPLEDGFFTCARVTVGEVPEDSLPNLDWKAQNEVSASLVGALAGFIRQEMTQPWGINCENHLRNQYAYLPVEQLTHPVFALLDFPVFDMGIVMTTFAASVCSPNELRLWSRPTYYHK